MCLVSWASGSNVTSLPLLMITTWSTLCCTSASTWLETRTVLPLAAKLRMKSRSQRAFRVEPVRRLVQDQQLGSPSSAPASPSLSHAERVAADATASRRRQLDELEHLIDPLPRRPLASEEPVVVAGVAERECQREEMVVARSARVEVGSLEHRPDAARRPLEILVAAAEDQRPTGGRLDEVEQHPKRCRLAGAVRAEEAGHRAALERSDRSSAASTSPNRFVRCSARITAPSPADGSTGARSRQEAFAWP